MFFKWFSHKPSEPSSFFKNHEKLIVFKKKWFDLQMAQTSDERGKWAVNPISTVVKTQGWESKVGSWESKVKSQESRVKSQKSKVKSQKSKAKSQKSKSIVKSQKPKEKRQYSLVNSQ